ncbi:ABC transporter ATP-binding protein [bacterium]|nr:MAG: ABC transporter ATP-binding protein [bacterium]
MTPAILLRDVRKTFVIANHSGASLKTLLLWWKRRELRKLEVLKGLTLEVAPGECVAIVGRNGAGKSTLLALLARIYKPNGGEIRLNGRVAPLLELGAGFHPDLSGLENVIFNGIILGLTRKEIRERLDSIIAFSELGDHIHAPARTYSSGMLARLGFAVAMHVDADILLVDEVLAVGDFEFERKCLARIREFKANGGTILLVSHQLDTIESFADRCVWLENGQVRLEGSPSVVLPEYLAN